MNSIKLLVYDFDGVMTDNKFFVDQHGNEMVQVNRSDGLGVTEIKKLGIKQLILSTEKNPVVTTRARKLGIPCIQGVDDKRMKLQNYIDDLQINKEEVAYVGNDINDLEAMRFVGMTFCPADAHMEKKFHLIY